MRLVVLAAVIMAVAGCSTGAPGPSTASEQQSGPSADTGSPSATPLPTGIPSSAQSIIATDALQDKSCIATADGLWTFKGNLRNDSTDKRTYTVAVAVTVGPEVRGHTVVVKEVPPGGSAEVEAAGFATVLDQGARCEAVVSQAVSQ